MYIQFRSCPTGQILRALIDANYVTRRCPLKTGFNKETFNKIEDPFKTNGVSNKTE